MQTRKVKLSKALLKNTQIILTCTSELLDCANTIILLKLPLRMIFEISTEKPFYLYFSLIAQLITISSENLYPIIVVWIVRGGDDDSRLQAQGARRRGQR